MTAAHCDCTASAPWLAMLQRKVTGTLHSSMPTLTRDEATSARREAIASLGSTGAKHDNAR